MDTYLRQVLLGDVSLTEVKAWLAHPSSLPPAPVIDGLPSLRSPSKLPSLNAVTPDQFRVSVLNHVKEEAEAIFAAAEQQAVVAHQLAASSSHTSKPQRPGYQRSLAPGVVSDMAFPALPVQPQKV